MAEVAIQPIGEVHAHILDQIEQRGYFKSNTHMDLKTLEEVQQGSSHVQRQDLHVSISIEDMYDIDPKNGSFKVRFVIYLTWEINLQSLLKSKSSSISKDDDDIKNIKSSLSADDIKVMSSKGSFRKV